MVCGNTLVGTVGGELVDNQHFYHLYLYTLTQQIYVH